jgi:transposase
MLLRDYEAALSRGDLTDEQWRILDPLLPDRGERGPAIESKRRTVNGILWVLRTGAPWRDMPERYGNWNSVFVRFTRSYTLLCIYKSSRQASNLPCGMWQMGHTIRQCGSG